VSGIHRDQHATVEISARLIPVLQGTGFMGSNATGVVGTFTVTTSGFPISAIATRDAAPPA
jgi:hypothetical protein